MEEEKQVAHFVFRTLDGCIRGEAMVNCPDQDYEKARQRLVMAFEDNVEIVFLQKGGCAIWKNEIASLKE